MKTRLTATLIFLLISSLSAQDVQKLQFDELYVSVLSRKKFVVGMKNKGTGLFRATVSDTGLVWRVLGFNNVRKFAFDLPPEKDNPLIYSANGNGLFVSRDRGLNWRVTTDWKITEVLHVRMDPNQQNTVYIGTAYGAYKSMDYGESWQRLSKRYVAGLHLDRSDSRHVLIGEEDGLIISKDGGKSFHRDRNLKSGINYFIQHPENAKTYIIGTETEGIKRSRDGGKGWQQLAPEYSNETIYWLHYGVNNPKRIFAVYHGVGILYSPDDGASWQHITDGFPENNAVSCIAQSPYQPEVFLAGTYNGGLHISRDNGQSWQLFVLPETIVTEIRFR